MLELSQRINSADILRRSSSGTRRWRTAAWVLATGAGLMAPGCSSPLRPDPADELRHSIFQSTTREIREAQNDPGPLSLTREDRMSRLQIEQRFLDEDEKLGGPNADLRTILKRTYEKDPNRPLPDTLPLGYSLTGAAPRTVAISLERAVRQTAQHNLNVQFSRLAPGVQESQVVAAQAAFDWLFFHNFQWSSTDAPRASPSIGGSTVGVSSDVRQAAEFTTGVRKRLVTGGQFTVQHLFRYTDVETDNLFNRPDPARETNIVLQLDQPLLRNFGSDVALAQVRIAKNMERDEIQNLKATLMQNVTDVEVAYWALVQAQENLKIVQRLFLRGNEVAEVIYERLKVDAKPVQYTEARSRAESRYITLQRAQNAVAQASDRLKVLMNDPEFLISSDIQLLSADSPIDEAIQYSLLDAIETAVANRPEVQRALLSIDNTAIRQIVATSGLLPRLDARLQMQINGLGGSTHGAYHDLTTGNNFDYLLGLNFEQPIGNREAEALYRQRRLERSQAVIAYRNTIQNVISEIVVALRNVVTNYNLISSTRAARIMAAESLRALDVEEELTQPKTAEFLNVKLSRQESLAQAEQDEIQALVDYNTALARLHAALGTTLKRSKINFEVPSVENVNIGQPVFPTWDER
ncbi:MAG: TolC family protein [Phycisphaerales bacterium]